MIVRAWVKPRPEEQFGSEPDVEPREISVDVERFEDARAELEKQLGDNERLVAILGARG